MLWFNFILGLNFIFLCSKLIIVHYHASKQRKIKSKPRIKLNHNIHTCILYWHSRDFRGYLEWMNKVIRIKLKFNFGAPSVVGICFHQLSRWIQYHRKEILKLTFGAQFIKAKELSAVCAITRTVDLIHDTRHLCTRSKIDGIKAMSRGISGGKQVIKFVNTSNRGRVCLLYQTRRRFQCYPKCWQDLRHYCLPWGHLRSLLNIVK